MFKFIIINNNYNVIILIIFLFYLLYERKIEIINVFKKFAIKFNLNNKIGVFFKNKNLKSKTLKNIFNKTNKIKLKNKPVKKIAKLVIVKTVLFLSKKSLEFEIANNIYKNYVTFNNFNMAKKYLKILNNAGINLKYPIYKLEFYSDTCNIDFQKNYFQFKNKSLKHNNKINKGLYEYAQDKKFYFLQKIYNIILTIKNLNNKKVYANFLIFIDDENFFQSVNKLIKYYNLDIKVYVKSDIDYKLLGAINYCNVNENSSVNNIVNIKKSINNLKQINTKNDMLKSKHCNSVSNILPLELCNNFDNKLFYISHNNKNFYFKNFTYNNYYLSSKQCLENTFNASVSAIKNDEINGFIFKLSITNYLDKILDVNFNFYNPIPIKTNRNAVYLIDNAKSYIYLYNIISDINPILLVGNFTKRYVLKHYFLSIKKLKLLPKSTTNFYFALCQNNNNNNNNFSNKILNNCNNKANDNTVEMLNENLNKNNNMKNIYSNNKNIIYFKDYINNNNDDSRKSFLENFNIKTVVSFTLNNIEKLYQFHNFNNKNLNKVLTENKTLNLLINDYLPQKIIKNYIITSFKNILLTNLKNCKFSFAEQDYLNLKNNIFDRNLLNKNLVFSNLNGLFLQSNNLYNIYLNLFYFKLGVFPTAFGLNINTDTTWVVNKALLKINNNNLIINIENKNLINEVKINNITYSNLQFLSLNTETKNLRLQL